MFITVWSVVSYNYDKVFTVVQFATVSGKRSFDESCFELALPRTCFASAKCRHRILDAIEKVVGVTEERMFEEKQSQHIQLVALVVLVNSYRHKSARCSEDETDSEMSSMLE